MKNRRGRVGRRRREIQIGKRIRGEKSREKMRRGRREKNEEE